ncbi:hypothetical protein N7G274_008187 [Stereocaulon virgatum]|uniref:Uncharacterized protein n=1 Tax=Stereocaulon virgatum TaxID=373712 RepID=A0ABR4A298_9LECA
MCQMSRLSAASSTHHQSTTKLSPQIIHNTTVHILHEHDFSTLDAWTAVNVPQVGIGLDHRKGVTAEFLEQYGASLIDGRQCFTVKESLAIISLQKKMVVEAYCNKMLSRNPNPNPNPSTRKEPEHREANPFELRRLYRAFYRYKIWSNIFSADKTLTSHSVLDAGYAATVYFGVFPVYEVEEHFAYIITQPCST